MKIDNRTLIIIWVVVVLIGMLLIFRTVEEKPIVNNEFVNPISDKIVTEVSETPEVEEVDDIVDEPVETPPLAIANEVEPKTMSVSKESYSDGGFDIPYNFKQLGVLHDSTYRYTWYSSRVLYHYRTPEWTLGSDGIYRDANGRVVVASDDYSQGTVVYSELFGECVVLDCGVGRSGTLDVYVGW